MSAGVILYGPPASGKDTVTHALVAVDSTYRHFTRLKAGPGRVEGYRMTTDRELAALRAAGGVIWENQRYGATYVIDAPALRAELAAGVPVLHLGQPEAITAVTSATPGTDWTVVYLTCPRDVATARIVARATGDTSERLRAWDDTKPLDHADLTLNTAIVGPNEAAEAIHSAVASRQPRTH